VNTQSGEIPRLATLARDDGARITLAPDHREKRHSRKQGGESLEKTRTGDSQEQLKAYTPKREELIFLCDIVMLTQIPINFGE
jgi:hypothetical protein